MLRMSISCWSGVGVREGLSVVLFRDIVAGDRQGLLNATVTDSGVCEEGYRCVLEPEEGAETGGGRRCRR